MRARLDRRIDPGGFLPATQCAGYPMGDKDMAALLRFLPVALGKRVVFHRPGAQSLTFDEAWLMRLVNAVRTDDQDAIYFALSSRVARHLRAPMRRLAELCADRLDAVDLELF